MWFTSPFSYLCSAGVTPSCTSSSSSLTVLFVRQFVPSLFPRVHHAVGTSSNRGSRSNTSARRGVIVGVNDRSVAASRIALYSAATVGGDPRSLFSISSSASGGGCGASGADPVPMVPDDAASLLVSVYNAEPTPQICITTTGSGGQALSWVLGVPGASACLLEANIPYSIAACDEIMAAGPPATAYCSREAAESLARDAYARAVSLCVGDSPERGPHALPDSRVIGVGCAAAVVSSRPRRGLHHCFVCAQTADGLAHYELNMAKGRRDRSGEDAAVSRVLLQAIAEAAGVPVSAAFKGGHLLTDDGASLSTSEGLGGGSRGGVEGAGVGGGCKDGETLASAVTLPTEVMPVAELDPEPDAVEELLAGRCDAMLIVPKDTREAPATGPVVPATVAAAAAAALDVAGTRPATHSGHPQQQHHGALAAEVIAPAAMAQAQAEAVVLRHSSTVKAALPRGATVVLPGSYNPLHRGHLGLLEAARALLSSEKLKAASCSPFETEEEQTKKASQQCSNEVHGIFEVSVSNVDKGGLAAEEIRRRCRQFSDRGGLGWPYPVVITRAPLFSQKARLFPGCAFVVGADTAKRIIDPRYYGNSQVEMVSALAEIRHLGCSFIVGGREDVGGRFLTLDMVLAESGLPESLRSMFLGLDESAFREDLSSTSIREGKATPGLV